MIILLYMVLRRADMLQFVHIHFDFDPAYMILRLAPHRSSGPAAAAINKCIPDMCIMKVCSFSTIQYPRRH